MNDEFTNNLLSSQDHTFLSLWMQVVNLYPERDAVIYGEERMSFAELDELSTRLARQIVTYDSRKRKIIGIFLERSVYFIAAIIAVMKAGGAYVPLDPDTLSPGRDESFPRRRLEFMLNDIDFSLVITRNQYISFLPAQQKDVLILEAMDDDKLPILSRVCVSTNDPIYGIYTSGSTGVPKLTIIDHSSVVNLFANLQKYVFSKIEDGKRIHSLNAPFGFDASIQQIVGLLSGGCICIIPSNIRTSAAALTAYILRNNISIFDCTPSQMLLLLKEEILKKCRHCLRAILIGGEAIPQKMWDELSGEQHIYCYNVYGPTECTVDSTFCLINSNEYSYPIIGRPFDGVKAYVLRDNFSHVSCGETGELFIGGLGVARGYHNRPDLNKQRFLSIPNIPGRLYRTGDYVQLLDDGSLRFIGRIDDQVKLRSHRIELAEITSNLNKHEKIVDSIARVVTLNGYDVLVAYIIPKTAEVIDPQELTSFLCQFVPGYMVPNYYIPMKCWPLTSSQKIDRQQLPLPQNELSVDLPAEGIEFDLAEMIKRILGIDSIGVYDNFLSLGGDSLRVMMLLAEVLAEYNVEVDFSDFFVDPTIQNLKKLLMDKGSLVD